MDAFQLLILPLFSFILLTIVHHKWRSVSRKNLPPSPWKLPIIGNLHQVGRLPHRSLQSLSARYGPLMLLQFGRVPVLVASSSDAAREIMKNQDMIFSNRPKLSFPDRLTYGSRDVVFTPYGEYWRQARSLCVLHLLSTKRVQSFSRVREEETSAMIERIEGQMESLSSWTTVNLSDEIVALTNDVVCRVALGRKYGDDGEGRRFKKFLSKFVEFVGTSSIGEYIPWLAWIDKVNGTDREVEKVARLFDEFLEDVLKEHRCKATQEGILGNGHTSDFVDVLLESQRDSRQGSPIEDDTIKALILNMFSD